jgi:predicted nucleic acid-binding protein
LYAFIEADTRSKSEAARELIRNGKIAISVQVVNEVCFNLIRKAGFSGQQILDLIEAFFAKYRVVDLSRSVLVNAVELRSEYALSFWDSLIVAAALDTNATVLYSEDLQDGLVIHERLQIVNPFRKVVSKSK